MGHTPYTRYVYLGCASGEVSSFENECQYNPKDQLGTSLQSYYQKFLSIG
jgi:hypothetical protein